MRLGYPLATIFVTFIGLIPPCTAAPNRTYVSGLGTDNNNTSCSRTSPCATFAAALAVTTQGGAINVLDPGDFGPATITQDVTIRAAYVEAGTLIAYHDGITVNANAGAKVVLQGLDLDGEGAFGGAGFNSGVTVNSGAAVYILNCSIRNFGNAGVMVASSTPGTRVFIRDSFIENNAGGVSVTGNGTNNSVAISNTLIDGNRSYALSVGSTGNSAALVNSILSGSPTGVTVSSGGTVNSIGPSNVITGSGSPTATTPYK